MSIRRIILFVAFFSFSIGCLFSQEEVKSFSKTVEVNPDVYFILKHSYGKADIQGTDQNKVIIEAVIKAKGEGAKEFVDAVVININENASNVSVKTDYPSTKSKSNFSYSVDYIVKIPLKARVKLENSFGSAFVKNINGDVDLDIAYGSIEVTKCLSKNLISGKFSNFKGKELGADSRVSNSYGKTIIDGATGDLEVTSSFGDCEVKNINGNVNITNGYGSIKIENVEGRGSLINQFGKISVKNMKGPFDITNKNSEVTLSNVESGRVTNSFGSINISDVKGKAGLTVNNKNGSVRIKKCNSNVLLQNSFDYIELKEIEGRVDLLSNNCSIRLNDISGDIKLDNTFGSVEIESITGDVNARNKSGRISVADIKKLGKTYTLENEFGPISIEFPKNLSAEISALTVFGNIHSEIPLEMNKTTNRMEGKAKIGDGYSKVKLETRNASIDIELSGKEAK